MLPYTYVPTALASIVPVADVIGGARDPLLLNIYLPVHVSRDYGIGKNYF